MSAIDQKEFLYYNKLSSCLSMNTCLFDIGGNRGDYTILFLSQLKNSKVHIFEPIWYNFLDLSHNFCNNLNVYVNMLGVDDVSGLKKFYVVGNRDEKDGMSSIHYRKNFFEFGYTEEYIRTITVDEYCDKRNIDSIGFVKIDTEGNEFNIIKGCSRMLKDKKIDFIQFEYGATWLDSHVTLVECVDFLKSMDYTTYDLQNGEFVLVDAENPLFTSWSYDNFLVSHKRLHD